LHAHLQSHCLVNLSDGMPLKGRFLMVRQQNLSGTAAAPFTDNHAAA